MTGRGMDNKVPKQKMTQEVSLEMQEMTEQRAAHCENSPAKKKRNHGSKSATSDSVGVFEAALAGANKEVNMLFSKYSEVLGERAAVDASQVRELEDILIEARNLESHLKEKKELLRRTLALISDKLHG